jgi:hypothetical protein
VVWYPYAPEGQNVWIYSDRPLDLTDKRRELEAAGYSFFIHMPEKPPQAAPEATRSSLFNWDGELLWRRVSPARMQRGRRIIMP